jgi:hypothetical protein
MNHLLTASRHLPLVRPNEPPHAISARLTGGQVSHRADDACRLLRHLRAAGIARHLGWAVAVTASADDQIVDPRRIELADPAIRTAPIEHKVKPFDDVAATMLVAQVGASVARMAVSRRVMVQFDSATATQFLGVEDSYGSGDVTPFATEAVGSAGFHFTARRLARDCRGGSTPWSDAEPVLANSLGGLRDPSTRRPIFGTHAGQMVSPE